MWALLVLWLAAAAAGGDCPRHCECKWRSGKESALCARAGLTAVPRLAPTTQLLDLAENRLPTLRDDTFAAAGLLNLQRLYLPACNLRTIRPHAFRALVNLVELDLSRNRLDNVPSHAFDSIPELRELRLTGNPITKIRDEAFKSLPHLVRLSIGSCKIADVEPRAFTGLEGSLEYLELDKNKLQVLHVAVLAPLRSLKGLELANNPWECTCALRPTRDWMLKRNVPAGTADCAFPPRLTAQMWDRLDLDDFACEPEVHAVTSQYTGVEGEEVTLVCKVNGIPAPRVRWLRAGKLIANLTTGSNVNSGRAFYLRSEGKTSNLTIKSADVMDSGIYVCTAENRAGKVEATLALSVDKKPQSNFGVRSVVAGMAVSAVIVLGLCLLGLCAYETRKKSQLDRWNEQIVTMNHRDDNYEKIEANSKNNVSRPVPIDDGRTRGDYRNVPSHDPEDDCEFFREVVREEQDFDQPVYEQNWRRTNFNISNTKPGAQERDLHIPRLNDYNNLRVDTTPESGPSSTSMRIIQPQFEHAPENSCYNNNTRSRPTPRRDRLDNDLSGSDSEKNYPDLIEMSSMCTPYLKTEPKYGAYNFYTIPRRKEGESRSPLLCSRRNSSGGDSDAYLDRIYEKTQSSKHGRRSNSFLDLSMGGSRYRNPSLPTSPTKEPSAVPSATPLLDLSGLRNYSRMDGPLEDYDFRASQLEKFLEEYRNLREQLTRMKETREYLQKSRDGDEVRLKGKERPSVAVTETSSSALADAASPLTLSPPEYKCDQRSDWLNSLLYRN